MKRLSKNQLIALSHLDEAYPQGLDDTYLSWCVGKNRKATIKSLEKMGFAAYFPYGNEGKGWWKITKDGREFLETVPEEEEYNDE